MSRAGASASLIALALVTVSAVAGAQASGPVPPSLPDAVLFKRIDSLVAATPAFSGIVAVGKRGAIVYLASAGLTKPGGAKPTSTTAFNLGSINKVFTEILVRQTAAEQGWSLDTTLAGLWPDYPNAAVAQAITIRQLLTHKSGVQGNIFAGDSAVRGKRRALRDYLPTFVDNPLQFKPGTRESYSNAGYVLLGLLLEQRTKRSYYDLVDERIYRFAGMTSAGYFARDSLPEFAVVGTTQRSVAGDPLDAPRLNKGSLPGRGSSAGGGYASAQDLLLFVQALRDRRIPQGLPPGIGVAGGSPGVNAVIEGALPGDRDLVILANVDPPMAETLSQIIRGWLGVKE
ncbi:MAG: beta-lactamase family protein [Gemmatimonadaceae bacterium]|nr:beta-lactamase family protein [Gemmatimonadaceae bacterium]